jgi:hypothetical protein
LLLCTVCTAFIKAQILWTVAGPEIRRERVRNESCIKLCVLFNGCGSLVTKQGNERKIPTAEMNFLRILGDEL